jgi:hypothetical protein
VRVDSRFVLVVLSDDVGGARACVVVGNSKVVARLETEVEDGEEEAEVVGEVEEDEVDEVPGRIDESVLPEVEDSQP